MRHVLTISLAILLVAPTAASACGGMSLEYDPDAKLSYEGSFPNPDLVDLEFSLWGDRPNEVEWLIERVSLSDLMTESGGKYLRRHLIQSAWEDGFDRNAPVDEQKLRILDAMLVAEADPNAVSFVGFTPLMALALRGEDSAMGAKQVSLLVRHGALVDHRAERGVTALHVAAQAGAEHIARALLENGANPALRDEDGLTAADIAEAKGWQDFATLLSGQEDRADLSLSKKQ